MYLYLYVCVHFMLHSKCHSAWLVRLLRRWLRLWLQLLLGQTFRVSSNNKMNGFLWLVYVLYQTRARRLPSGEWQVANSEAALLAALLADLWVLAQRLAESFAFCFCFCHSYSIICEPWKVLSDSLEYQTDRYLKTSHSLWYHICSKIKFV